NDIGGPTVSMTSTNVSCNGGSDGSATASVSGGTSPYTYLWDDASAQTSATASNLEAGTYSVTVTDANNCTATESVTITEPPAITLVSETVVNPVNPGDNGTITLLYSGGTGVLYYTIGTETNTTGIFIRPSGTYTYSVTDDLGCGPVTGEVSIGDFRQLNIKVFLEGFYRSATNSMVSPLGDVPGGNSDVLLVELRNAADYSIIEDTTTVFIKTDGTLSLTIPPALNGSYYITIAHRNSVTTVSALPVSFSGGDVTYDFTTDISKAYGNNMIEVSTGVWALYAGDVDKNGNIDTTDMSWIDNDSSNFETGYIVTDVNGDGIVDTYDMTYVDNNSAQFITVITP
ncbi:MAG: hypothetical protein RBS33_13335, partial [Lentimicrobium sp.]|nr:hypothetical protein [Lentimicrobium sp.]